MSTRDFDVVLNSLKYVVVGEEVQCFDFPLPRDTKHKPIDIPLITNIDEEEGQEKSTSVYTQKYWMYSQMLATLLGLTANMQHFLQRG
jgi:hypothetical protein